jgi:hypothetical protein
MLSGEEQEGLPLWSEAGNSHDRVRQHCKEASQAYAHALIAEFGIWRVWE